MGRKLFLRALDFFIWLMSYQLTRRRPSILFTINGPHHTDKRSVSVCDILTFHKWSSDDSGPALEPGSGHKT